MQTTPKRQQRSTEKQQSSANATVREAAAYIGISRSTLYELQYAGFIRPVKFGRATRFRWEDVERLAREGTRSAAD